MCFKVDCKNCGKATWQGCGMHVTSALKGYEEKDRCPNWKKGASRPCGSDSANNSGGGLLSFFTG